MKLISKRTLFIFMSILMAQSCHVQAAAPAVTGFFKSCGQTICKKVGAVVMENIIKPAFVLTRSVLVLGTTGATGYLGLLYAQHHGKIPFLTPPTSAPTVSVPTINPSTAPDVLTSVSTGLESISTPKKGLGFFDMSWASQMPTPKAIQKIVTETGKQVPKKATSWFPWIPSIKEITSKIPTPREVISKIPVVSTIAEHPGKSFAAYAIAGCVAVYTVKRLQLYYVQKKFLSALEAAQTTADNHQWQQCKAMMQQFSPTSYPDVNQITAPMAIKFVSNLRPSDMENKALYVFPLHLGIAYLSKKMASI